MKYLKQEVMLKYVGGDETYYQFSTSIKRFLTSRYEDTITKYYKSYYV
jgi:hypothetical protein